MKIAIASVPSRRGYVDSVLLRRFPNAVVYEDTEGRGNLWQRWRILKDSPDGVLYVEDDAIIPPWFLEQQALSSIEGEAMSYFAAGHECPALDFYNQLH